MSRTTRGYDTDFIAPQPVIDTSLPFAFVCFHPERRPMKFKKSHSGESYDCWIWNREWVWDDEVSEGTARLQFEDAENEVFSDR